MNTKKMGRILSALLALAMVCTLFVGVALPTSAADDYVYIW